MTPFNHGRTRPPNHITLLSPDDTEKRRHHHHRRRCLCARLSARRHHPTVRRYAQLVFSLFALVSLFSKSVFGLPFLVVGLYKCGYPETLGFFIRAENIAQREVGG